MPGTDTGLAILHCMDIFINNYRIAMTYVINKEKIIKKDYINNKRKQLKQLILKLMLIKLNVKMEHIILELDHNHEFKFKKPSIKNDELKKKPVRRELMETKVEDKAKELIRVKFIKRLYNVVSDSDDCIVMSKDVIEPDEFTPESSVVCDNELNEEAYTNKSSVSEDSSRINKSLGTKKELGNNCRMTEEYKDIKLKETLEIKEYSDSNKDGSRVNMESKEYSRVIEDLENLEINSSDVKDLERKYIEKYFKPSSISNNEGMNSDYEIDIDESV